jgi:hypothetical protein
MLLDLMHQQAAFPPTDASGDVDLQLIEHYVRLTPAERLRRLEDFVNFITEVRTANGMAPWSASENCSNGYNNMM